MTDEGWVDLGSQGDTGGWTDLSVAQRSPSGSEWTDLSTQAPAGAAVIPAPAAPAGPQPSGAPFTTNPETAPQISEAIKTIPGLHGAATIAGTAMKAADALSYGVRYHMMTKVAAASVLANAISPGSDTAVVAHDLYKKLNPNDELFPNPHYSDVTDFVVDKASGADKFVPWAQETTAGKVARAALGTFKVGLGVAVDTMFDPSLHMQIGGLTKVGLELAKVGKVAEIGSDARNIIGIKPLFSSFGATPLVTKADVLSVGEKITSKIPMPAPGSVPGMALSGVGKIAETATAVVRALSPYTGDPVIDYAMNQFQIGKNAGRSIVEDMRARLAQGNYTAEEKRLIQHVQETTTNLKSGIIPEKILSAAEKGHAAREGKGAQKLFTTIEEVKQQAREAILKNAEKFGITGPLDGRIETLVNGVVECKQSATRAMEATWRAGNLTTENAAGKVLENYSPHVMDPVYSQNKTAEGVFKGWASKFDPSSKKRIYEGTVSEVNKAFENVHGMKGFFIEDPFVANAVREARAVHSENVSKFLDVVGEKGMRAGNAPKGWLPIQHPEFEGKQIIGVDEGGIKFRKNLKDMVFAPDVATKVSYMIGASPAGNVGAVASAVAEFANKYTPIGVQNRFLRTTTFMAPGMWLRNLGGNTIKGLAYDVGYTSWKDAITHSYGEFKPITGRGNILNPKGEIWTQEKLTKMFRDVGLEGGLENREGIGEMLHNASQSIADEVVKRRGPVGKAVDLADSAIHFVGKWGEKGDMMTRKAFMIQKVVHEGYTVEAAADLMTRVMFNYNRNSPVTNAIRAFMPFFQHPLKSALSFVDVVGNRPGVFNAYESFKRVLGNALLDPMSQKVYNSVVPNHMRTLDTIFGPMFPANSIFAAAFAKPGQAPTGDVALYIHPGMGMEILNHFQSPGWSPAIQSLITFVKGEYPEGPYGQPGQKIGDMSARINQLLHDNIMGSINMPNTMAAIKQTLGIGNPEYFQPATILAMRSLFSQVGGVTPLMQDTMNKIQALGFIEKGIKEDFSRELSNASKGLSSPQSYSGYLKSLMTKQGHQSLTPMTNAEWYLHVQDLMREKQGQNKEDMAATEGAAAYIAAQSKGQKPDALAYARMLLSVHKAIKETNEAAHFGLMRSLQMTEGAKSQKEARDRIDPKK